jgi:hypothetical protein
MAEATSPESEKRVERQRRDREVLGLDDFTEADLAEIRAAEPPPETALFDHEPK